MSVSVQVAAQHAPFLERRGTSAEKRALSPIIALGDRQVVRNGAY